MKTYEIKTTSQIYDTYHEEAESWREAWQKARFDAKRGGYRVLSVKLWRDPLLEYSKPD